MTRSYHVTVWNETVERGYTILATSHQEARDRAIKAELKQGTPFYQIHIESVQLW